MKLTQKNKSCKKSKNVLDQAMVYLCGPMDDAKDNGIGWRRYFIEQLKAKGINMVVLDPTNKVASLNPETLKERKTHIYLAAGSPRIYSWEECRQISVKGGKENAPSWLFVILDYRLMFDNEDECINYLNRMNKGLIRLGTRWVLIRKRIKGILAE